MKKIFSMAAMAIAVATMMSCNGNNPKASLKNDVDTLSYAIGVTYGENLSQQLVWQGIDTTYMAQFIQGLIEGVDAVDDKSKTAYLAGVGIGQQLVNRELKGLNYNLFGDDSTKAVSTHNLLAGVINVLSKNGQKMTVQEADSIANLLFERIKTRTLEEKYGENKAAGEKFLEENAKNDSVQTVNVTIDQYNGTKLDSYFQYKVLKEGNGTIAADTNQVVVNYAGRLIDGTEFDNSDNHGESFVVDMRRPRVIQGWIEALKRMPAGSIWEVYIPQELGYGSNNNPNSPILPFSTLIFKIEVVEVK